MPGKAANLDARIWVTSLYGGLEICDIRLQMAVQRIAKQKREGGHKTGARGQGCRKKSNGQPSAVGHLPKDVLDPVARAVVLGGQDK